MNWPQVVFCLIFEAEDQVSDNRDEETAAFEENQRRLVSQEMEAEHNFPAEYQMGDQSFAFLQQHLRKNKLLAWVRRSIEGGTRRNFRSPIVELYDLRGGKWLWRCCPSSHLRSKRLQNTLLCSTYWYFQFL